MLPSFRKKRSFHFSASVTPKARLTALPSTASFSSSRLDKLSNEDRCSFSDLSRVIAPDFKSVPHVCDANGNYLQEAINEPAGKNLYEKVDLMKLSLVVEKTNGIPTNITRSTSYGTAFGSKEKLITFRNYPPKEGCVI
jgi:hypothetical protein